jgi:hypothetical protein
MTWASGFLRLWIVLALLWCGATVALLGTDEFKGLWQPRVTISVEFNRQKPFTDALRVALLSGGGRRLRTIAEKLAEKAEQGDLQAIQQIADRLDGKPSQAIERGDVSVEVLSDRELFAIIRGGSPEPEDVPSYLMIAGPKQQ